MNAILKFDVFTYTNMKYISCTNSSHNHKYSKLSKYVYINVYILYQHKTKIMEENKFYLSSELGSFFQL